MFQCTHFTPCIIHVSIIKYCRRLQKYSITMILTIHKILYETKLIVPKIVLGYLKKTCINVLS